MASRTRSWLVASAAILTLALAAEPTHCQTPWPTPEVVSEGDTVVAREGSLFVFTREQMEALRTRQRNDSIRLAGCRRDRASLREEADTLRFALAQKGRIIAADSAVIDRLDAGGGFLSEVGSHLTAFGAGTLAGFAGDCVVD